MMILRTFAILTIFCTFPLAAQVPQGGEFFPTQATVHLPTDIRLFSPKKYSHSLKDVRIRAAFTHRPTGRTITVSGYWHGDVSNGTWFYVRFAPTVEGEWQWSITSSDTSNGALHRRNGVFMARAASSNVTSSNINPLAKHGAVRVAANRRTLEYADGTPFFWLGDTAWNIPENSTKEEVMRFLDDRASKGFTVVQLTFASASSFNDFGNRNRAGETLYLRNGNGVYDKSLYNPRWFDYTDSVITWANARGIVVGILPQFATGVMEDFDRGWVTATKLLTREEALIGIRYLAARYAGHHVVWITGGDVQYNTPSIRAYWEQYGKELRATNGAQQLVSIHPEGLTASYDFFDNTASWLDFHMLQSSHQPWSENRTEMLRRGYVRTPPKPILNAEPPYEGIELNFFLSDIQAAFVGGKYPATDYDVRLAAYMSIFSGGLVGITYGANGIFQWNSPTRADLSFNPRYNALEALSLPGSAQYGIAKQILTQLAWHEMVPRLDLLNSIEAEQGTALFTGLIASNAALCLYSAKGMRSCTVSCGGLRGEGGLIVKWISPASGIVTESVMLPFSTRPLTLRAPDARQDWLLTVQRANGFLPRLGVDLTAIKLTRFLTNQAGGSVELAFSVPEAGTLEIDVCDTRGAAVLRQTLQVSRGEAYFVLPISARGAYFYSARFQNERLQSRLTGKFVQQ